MPPPVVCLLDGESPLAPAALHLLAQHNVQVMLGHSETADADRIRHLGPCAATHAHPDPRDPTADFEADVIEWLMRERPDVVIPLGLASTQLLSHHARDLREEGVCAPVPPQGVLSVAIDRLALLDQARRLGIATPHSAPPGSAIDAIELARCFTLPPAVAPRMLSRPEGAVQCETHHDSSAAAAAMESRTGTPPLLLSEIPADRGWLAVTVLCDTPGGAMVRVTEAWTGWDAERGHPRWRSIIDHRVAAEQAMRLLGGLGWVGPATVQFALDPRALEPALLQLWPGLSGGLALADAAGLDLLWPLVEWALDEMPTQPAHYRTDVFMPWAYDGVPWLFAPQIDSLPRCATQPPWGEQVRLAT